MKSSKNMKFIILSEENRMRMNNFKSTDGQQSLSVKSTPNNQQQILTKTKPNQLGQSGVNSNQSGPQGKISPKYLEKMNDIPQNISQTSFVPNNAPTNLVPVPSQQVNKNTLQQFHPNNQRTLQPINQNTLKPINQNTFQPINQNTLQPINQNTLQPINQNTLQPINQNTLQPINQNTLQPINQNTLQPINQNTLKPINQKTFQNTNKNGFHIMNQNKLRQPNLNNLKLLNKNTLLQPKQNTFQQINQNTLKLPNQNTSIKQFNKNTSQNQNVLNQPNQNYNVQQLNQNNFQLTSQNSLKNINQNTILQNTNTSQNPTIQNTPYFAQNEFQQNQPFSQVNQIPSQANQIPSQFNQLSSQVNQMNLQNQQMGQFLTYSQQVNQTITYLPTSIPGQQMNQSQQLSKTLTKRQQVSQSLLNRPINQQINQIISHQEIKQNYGPGQQLIESGSHNQVVNQTRQINHINGDGQQNNHFSSNSEGFDQYTSNDMLDEILANDQELDQNNFHLPPYNQQSPTQNQHFNQSAYQNPQFNQSPSPTLQFNQSPSHNPEYNFPPYPIHQFSQSPNKHLIKQEINHTPQNQTLNELHSQNQIKQEFLSQYPVKQEFMQSPSTNLQIIQSPSPNLQINKSPSPNLQINQSPSFTQSSPMNQSPSQDQQLNLSPSQIHQLNQLNHQLKQLNETTYQNQQLNQPPTQDMLLNPQYNLSPTQNQQFNPSNFQNQQFNLANPQNLQLNLENSQEGQFNLSLTQNHQINVPPNQNHQINLTPSQNQRFNKPPLQNQELHQIGSKNQWSSQNTTQIVQPFQNQQFNDIPTQIKQSTQLSNPTLSNPLATQNLPPANSTNMNPSAPKQKVFNLTIHENLPLTHDQYKSLTSRLVLAKFALNTPKIQKKIKAYDESNKVAPLNSLYHKLLEESLKIPKNSLQDSSQSNQNGSQNTQLNNAHLQNPLQILQSNVQNNLSVSANQPPSPSSSNTNKDYLQNATDNLNVESFKNIDSLDTVRSHTPRINSAAPNPNVDVSENNDLKAVKKNGRFRYSEEQLAMMEAAIDSCSDGKPSLDTRKLLAQQFGVPVTSINNGLRTIKGRKRKANKKAALYPTKTQNGMSQPTPKLPFILPSRTNTQKPYNEGEQWPSIPLAFDNPELFFANVNTDSSSSSNPGSSTMELPVLSMPNLGNGFGDSVTHGQQQMNTFDTKVDPSHIKQESDESETFHNPSKEQVSDVNSFLDNYFNSDENFMNSILGSDSNNEKLLLEDHDEKILQPFSVKQEVDNQENKLVRIESDSGVGYASVLPDNFNPDIFYNPTASGLNPTESHSISPNSEASLLLSEGIADQDLSHNKVLNEEALLSQYESAIQQIGQIEDQLSDQVMNKQVVNNGDSEGLIQNNQIKVEDNIMSLKRKMDSDDTLTETLSSPAKKINIKQKMPVKRKLPPIVCKRMIKEEDDIYPSENPIHGLIGGSIRDVFLNKFEGFLFLQVISTEIDSASNNYRAQISDSEESTNQCIFNLELNDLVKTTVEPYSIIKILHFDITDNKMLKINAFIHSERLDYELGYPDKIEDVFFMKLRQQNIFSSNSEKCREPIAKKRISMYDSPREQSNYSISATGFINRSDDNPDNGEDMDTTVDIRDTDYERMHMTFHDSYVEGLMDSSGSELSSTFMDFVNSPEPIEEEGLDTVKLLEKVDPKTDLSLYSIALDHSYAMPHDNWKPQKVLQEILKKKHSKVVDKNSNVLKKGRLLSKYEDENNFEMTDDESSSENENLLLDKFENLMENVSVVKNASFDINTSVPTALAS